MSIDENEYMNEFERSFWQLSRKMSYLWKQIYEQKFPGSQSYILFSLAKSGPARMSELAKVLYLTPGAVTTASDKLIEQGYATRTRDKNDRRAVKLALTDKGKSTLSDLQNHGKEIMKSVFHDISDSELEIMLTIFKQANLNIDKIRKEFV